MPNKQTKSQTSSPNAANPDSARSPGSIEEIHFKSWEEFKSNFGVHLFAKEPFRRGRFLFRGHSDPGWRLSTTFDRMFSNQPKATRLQIADELLEVFKR
ncbi:MAG TPA: hypothetical protein VGV87_02825, partial [Blastocatellia bacterium]|nr:hypothetical protein [Blastocatellia bacterium]